MAKAKKTFLNPCPFCGSSDVLLDTHAGEIMRLKNGRSSVTFSSKVWCERCFANGPLAMECAIDRVEAKAIERWNVTKSTGGR